MAQVGTGARSEKIRTYNYKDSRCTDHRLNRWPPAGFMRARGLGLGRGPPCGYAHTHAYSWYNLLAVTSTYLTLTRSHFGLDGVLGGAIEPIIQQCIALDEQERHPIH